MSIGDDSTQWVEMGGDEFPDLDTEEGRDSWMEILMAQDDDTLIANGTGWTRALVVADEQGNMVVRFVYPDGREELFDLQVRRSVDVVPEKDRN